LPATFFGCAANADGNDFVIDCPVYLALGEFPARALAALLKRFTGIAAQFPTRSCRRFY
jgi:hypothetical protein